MNTKERIYKYRRNGVLRVFPIQVSYIPQYSSKIPRGKGFPRSAPHRIISRNNICNRNNIYVIESFSRNNICDINNFKPPSGLNNDSIIFVVTSAIHPIIRGKYSPEERLEQTLGTFKSIKKYVPNAIIIMAEISSLTTNEIDKLYPFVDTLVLFSETIKNISEEYTKAEGEYKSIGETVMLLLIAKELEKLPFNRLLKLSGRYYLVNGFSLQNFSQEYINYTRITSQSISTVLYSIPKYKIKSYIRALEQSYKNPMQTIEHSLSAYLPKKDIIEIFKTMWGGKMDPINR